MGKEGDMPTSVRFHKDLEHRLDVLAAETGRSKAFYIREAVAEYLDDLEDIFLAEKRLEELRAGRSRTYTLEEVEDRLGLAD